MSHITLSCNLSVKIDFHLILTQNIMKIKKKGLDFFIGREKV